MKEFYPITIAGVKRELKLCPLNEKLYIGAFVIIGDPSLPKKQRARFSRKHPNTITSFPQNRKAFRSHTKWRVRTMMQNTLLQESPQSSI